MAAKLKIEYLTVQDWLIILPMTTQHYSLDKSPRMHYFLRWNISADQLIKKTE
jgi:hypothetical protein